MESTQKVPVSIYAEMTPNPAVLKFVANIRLIAANHVEFTNIEEAAPSPLATMLFHLPFVKEVFISSNYVAITKYDIVEWDEITLEVREMIREHLASGKAVINQVIEPEGKTDAPKNLIQEKEHPQARSAEDLSEHEKQIEQLLQEYVIPAVEQDGGNIKLLRLEDEKLLVQLQGACSGCPSSTLTLKQGIHNLINQMMPGVVKDVVAV